MKKALKLSKGFWHKFIPHSHKLISPQNIKFEIWDLTTHKIAEKWHPNIFCVRNCTFDKSGEKFVLVGGCTANKSEFNIYDSKTFEPMNQFWIPEQACNAVFTAGDYLIFGTWEGNIYKVNIKDNIVITETTTIIDQNKFKDYAISAQNEIKLLQVENTMITLAEIDQDSDTVFFVVRPKSFGEKTDVHLLSDYILMYHLQNGTTSEIRLPLEKDRYSITGIKYHNHQLAILKTRYGGYENKNVFHHADLFVFHLEKGMLEPIKTDFKVRDVFADVQSLSWSVDGKLACIALTEVVILNPLKNKEEVSVSIDRPTSVEFSFDGKLLAIGSSTKAILQPIE